MNAIIWYHIVDLKMGEYYLIEYIKRQRTLRKTFNIIGLRYLELEVF